ncbi:hypothetical protein GCM10011506_09680 [Marivirga lumbricoides]|uniref:DUF6036 domain-containing protein n=1 Tax=Marivirga lumbricoides TaxID=1046115 RepID=A0ABQ1LSG5_9BACT|nr:hypothetical protein GCM10011506_09680 [Marivirga lumbricoides]
MNVSKHNANLIQFTKLTRLAKSLYFSNKENEPRGFMDINDNEVLGLLQSLSESNVEYMLVGGVAAVFHGHVRTTGDIDLWVNEVPENKKRLVNALSQIGVPAAEGFLNVPLIPGWSSLTIGDSGFTAYFMAYTSFFKQADFNEVYKRSVKGEINGIKFQVIHINDLIKEKKRLGRHKDLDDVENLEKIKKTESNSKFAFISSFFCLSAFCQCHLFCFSVSSDFSSHEKHL